MNIKTTSFCIAAMLLCTALLVGCNADMVQTVSTVRTTVSDIRSIASETPPPTPAPSFSPLPTAVPTPVPSEAPSPVPTSEPTPEPTAEPTPETAPLGDSFLTGSLMAPYLRLAPYTALSNDELRTDFLKTVSSRVVLSYSIDENVSSIIDPVIFLEPSNTGFLLECVDYCGLTDAGTFDVFPDCSMQYKYLIDVNLFSAHALKSLSVFGGSEAAAAGDVIFWLDDDGKAINYAVILEYHDEYMCIAITRSTGLTASFVLYSGNVSDEFISRGIAVHLKYPCIEQTVFLFLTNEMGYTPAAACGVMANIYMESSFRNKIDVGSYGLCQWQSNRRNTLINWCNSSGLDYTTVEGQLMYLRYELENEYPYLSEFMLGLGNTKDDAYNGARQWCFKYEQPADIGSMGYLRGKSARDDFFPIYSQY